jgi:hypothetical protein
MFKGEMLNWKFVYMPYIFQKCVDRGEYDGIKGKWQIELSHLHTCSPFQNVIK